jgi:hypothetical protein
LVLGPHNAEVEGSSPSLTTKIKHLLLRSSPYDVFAGPQAYAVSEV